MTYLFNKEDTYIYVPKMNYLVLFSYESSRLFCRHIISKITIRAKDKTPGRIFKNVLVCSLRGLKRILNNESYRIGAKMNACLMDKMSASI